MLDANTLQWLEDRDALQFMFDQYTLPDGDVSFDDDIADAVEAEMISEGKGPGRKA